MDGKRKRATALVSSDAIVVVCVRNDGIENKAGNGRMDIRRT